MMNNLLLRDVTEDDLPIFFEQQLDPDANYMAAFSAKNPGDREAFMAKWTRILANDTTKIKTILFNGQVAGSVLIWVDEELGHPEVSYWLGKEYWGKGIATQALTRFIALQEERPLYGRAVKDNLASIRVLEKCGFKLIGQDKGFANARGMEVEEVILILNSNETKG
jgi:RimJ/RimL family protein N-acetyltransferase